MEVGGDHRHVVSYKGLSKGDLIFRIDFLLGNVLDGA